MSIRAEWGEHSTLCDGVRGPRRGEGVSTQKVIGIFKTSQNDFLYVLMLRFLQWYPSYILRANPKLYGIHGNLYSYQLKCGHDYVKEVFHQR